MVLDPLQQKTLQIAKGKLGQREATGRNDGAFMRLLQRWAAKGYAWLDNQPWCVMFATWCIHEACRALGRASRIPERASSSRLFAWYRREGLLLARPIPGCVGMVRAGRRTGSDGGGRAGWLTHSHTFLVHDVRNGMVVGVDGNYRNAVGWSKRPVGDCDYGRIC